MSFIKRVVFFLTSAMCMFVLSGAFALESVILFREGHPLGLACLVGMVILYHLGMSLLNMGAKKAFSMGLFAVANGDISYEKIRELYLAAEKDVETFLKRSTGK